MKVGDLVLLRGNLWTTWREQGKCGVVISVHSRGSTDKFLVTFSDNVIKDFSGYEDQFEVINEVL